MSADPLESPGDGSTGSIPPGAWKRAVAERAGRGDRFLGLYAAGQPPDQRVVLILEEGDGERVIVGRPSRGSVATVTEFFPAAAWDEREAHDLYGIEFKGHRPLRPMVDHVDEPGRWVSDVSGTDVHQVAVGPIHAGVIESGHFRFHLVGERILALDLRLFYKHRGLEKLAEGSDPEGSRRIVARICGSSSVAMQVSLAQAWEAHLGLVPDEAMRRARTVLIELERLYNHLGDLGHISDGVGFSPGSMAYAALEERARRLNRELFGHRLLFETVAVGASRVEVGAEDLAAARVEVEAIGTAAAALWREILFTASVQDRLRGTGKVGPATAASIGMVGPAARASGLNRDRRAAGDTGLAYPVRFEPVRLEHGEGDVAARCEIRALEIEQTCRLLDGLLSEPGRPSASRGLRPGRAGREGPAAGSGETERRSSAVSIGRVEGPRGEILCALEADGDRVRRLHLRPASYANWPALEHAVIGDILPDFPLINKSFELSYAAVDR